MKRTARYALRFGLLAVAAIIAAALWAQSSRPPRTSAPLVPASSLARTDVLPHMDGPLTPGRNYVYCGTFQIAWNDLEDTIIKAPLRLEGAPPMAAALSARKFSASDVSADCYVALSGRVEPDTAAKIQEAVARKFPDAKLPTIEFKPKSVLYTFAYLEKTLRFEHPFDRMPEPLTFVGSGGKAWVKSFGIYRDPNDYEALQSRHELLAPQVTILAYRTDEEFVLQLLTTSPKDELVLARIPPGKTLADTIAAVQEFIAWQRLPRTQDVPDVSPWDAPKDYPGGPKAYVDDRVRELYKQGLCFSPELGVDDTLKVPLLNLNVLRDYAEVMNHGILNAGWDGWTITQALQTIRFRLDECGAVLKSMSQTEVMGIPRAPRRFVFDRPFLIYLKEKDARAPYFAMWVENPDVLETAE